MDSESRKAALQQAAQFAREVVKQETRERKNELAATYAGKQAARAFLSCKGFSAREIREWVDSLKFTIGTPPQAKSR